MKKQKEVVEQITKDLLKEIGLKTEINLSQTDESINVQIDTPESGLLIGYHGETLNAIQTMINLMAYKKLGEWQRIIIEVGDYRQKREQVLNDMAIQAVATIKSTKQAYHFPPMPAFERRIIHLALSNDPEIETTSEGERDRHVVAELKKVQSAKLKAQK